MLKKKSKLLGILTAALMITLVIGLVAAISTMNPRVTYTGTGSPDNETGREGDLYVEIDTNVLWLFKNDGWEMFAIFPTVVNGTDGPIGPQGEPGPVGATGPAGADGIDGTDGADGKDGTQIYNELMYTCTDSLGNNGDFFLFANGTLNVKIDGSWMFYSNLVGPQGIQGEQGPVGATGPEGPQGETGETGPMGPQGEVGPQGIQGEQGPIGLTGAAGADGIDGTDGLIGSDGLHGINGTDETIELGILWWIVVLIAALTGLALAISVYALRKKGRK